MGRQGLTQEGGGEESEKDSSGYDLIRMDVHKSQFVKFSLKLTLIYGTKRHIQKQDVLRLYLFTHRTEEVCWQVRGMELWGCRTDLRNLVEKDV